MTPCGYGFRVCVGVGSVGVGVGEPGGEALGEGHGPPVESSRDQGKRP